MICESCGSEENVTLNVCPFAYEIRGDETLVCLCENCRHERAMDI